MSLLLDALRRAEQEKLAKQAERPATPERERAAATKASPAASGLELQPLASGVAGAAAANAPAMPGRSEHESAQALLKAKPPAAEPARRGGALWAAAGAILVVVAAVGVYVWYSVQALAPKTVVRTRPPAIPAPMPLPQVARSAATPGPAAAASAPFTAAPAIATVTPQPVPEPAKSAAAPQSTDQMVMNLLREAAAPAAQPLRLSQTTPTPRVPADVATGYEALRNGNLATARRSYAAALASDPSNLDAQLGLATVEARGGNRAAAAAHYRRALELDPRNATALAGLASLADFSRPDALESQLREDVARHPQSSALRFTLGNLLASQSRWNEAQVEFFEAHRLEPASADIVFNLAVSLDHLGQSRLATDYYRRALAAARTQATQFDPAPVERRLAELGVETLVPGR